jgi:transposase
MEATGIYWIPLYEILDARGFDLRLVNAHHVKSVPGRKSDVSDCEWLRELNIVGSLRGSFRPTEAMVALRGYLRHRQTLVESAGIHTQRMQKALVQMNVQLPLVVSDITGVTGLRILRDLVAGQHDPLRLAEHRDHRCRASKAEIIAALTGNYRPEHLNLTQIDGLTPYTALALLSEIGTDMARWPTEKHFTSWLTLAPKNKISGGRLLSSRTPRSANRAAGVLRMTAMSLGRTQTALGAFYRRLAGRIGKPQAITATARKLAILVYRALTGDLVYRDLGADGYDAQQRTRILRQLRRRVATLGFDLVSRETGEILNAAV